MRFDARALPLALAGARFPLPRLHREREGLRHLSGFPFRRGLKRFDGPRLIEMEHVVELVRPRAPACAGSTPRPASWATSPWPQTGSRFVAWRTSPSRSNGSVWGKPSNSRSGMAEATHQRQLKSLTWKYGRPPLVLEFFDAGPSFSRRAHPVVGALQPTAMLRATISTPRRGAAAGRPLPRDRQAPTPPSPPAEPLRRECGSPADPACARGAPRPCAR